MSQPRNLSLIANTLNSNATFASITDTGNLTFTGTGNRITGDFSSTPASRVAFQTSTANGNTNIEVIPNGTSTTTALNLESDPALTNGTFFQLGLNGGTDARLTSAIRGTGTYLPMTFYTGGSERMRLDTSGNVGIGTTSPNQKLQVHNTAASSSFALFTNATTGSTGSDGTYFGVDSSGIAYVWNQENTSMLFGTNNGERMRIDASGNVGIGTSSPATKVHALTPSATAVAYRAGNSVSYAEFQVDASGNSQLIAPGGVQIFNTNGAERMRIDSSGNVGIGTSLPGYKFEIQGNVNNYFGQRIYNTNAGSSAVSYLQIGNDTNGATAQLGLNSSTNTTNFGGANGLYLSNGLSAAIAFATAGSERMRINSSGYVFINRTTDIGNGILQISGVVDSRVAIQTYQNATTAQGAIWFNNPNGNVGSITTSGSVTSYNVTSDQRLKENIQDADSASALIDSLQVRQFDWKSDNTHQRYGFVAQELVTVAPEAVHQPVNEDDMMAVDYSKLVPMLVKAHQEQQALITTLTARIEALEAK